MTFAIKAEVTDPSAESFATDVRPMLAEWRKKKGIDPDPMKAYRGSGYEAKAAKEREASRAARGVSAGASYACSPGCRITGFCWTVAGAGG